MRVLYISYTGITDPLGESQVLQYVLALAKSHEMTLLTFEKPHLLADKARMEKLRAQCKNAGVNWVPRVYHRKPGIPATLYDIFTGRHAALRLAKSMQADIVHARSYIAGLMALYVKKRTGARYIFDMRGFWPDERVDGGIWTTGSLVYKFFKKVERKLFLNADAVVSLTRSGAREIEKFDYLVGRLPPITVIPTCTNLEIFAPSKKPKVKSKGFTLGYVGSVGSWYLFDYVARAVKMVFDQDDSARFLIVNKSEHDAVKRGLSQRGVDLNRVEIVSANFDTVGDYIGQMDAGIFFIKPVFSKRASSPTRLGEFLACGKPCLANAKVGDVEEDLHETGTGIALSDFDDESLLDGISQLRVLAASPGITKKCRDAAETRFSLDVGVQRYDALYRKLG